MTKLRLAPFGLLSLIIILAGCASSGEIDNPLNRRATWFSFISGEDIATACRVDGRERYRLTYIADRNVQVRIYDIDADVTPVAQLRSRIMTVAASDWFPWEFLSDPSRPFRPFDKVETLPADKLEAIRQDLLASGWSTQPAPVGKKIASTSYAWLVAGCRNGEFSFQAYEYPDADFQALTFPEILYEVDQNSIDVRQPPTDGERRTLTPNQAIGGRSAADEGGNIYYMRVNANGVSVSH
jgi:hypothetical protein